MVSKKPLDEMMRYVVADFVHPPGHFFLVHCCLGLPGSGVYQSRLLSVIFGALSVVVLYWFGKYVFDWAVGILASAFLAVSQLAIMESQEVRPYSQLLFLVLCSGFCL